MLDNNHIVTIRTRRGTQVFTGNNQDAGRFKEFPVIVLVNKGSASASEIVAAYLKNYSKAVEKDLIKVHEIGVKPTIELVPFGLHYP